MECLKIPIPRMLSGTMLYNDVVSMKWRLFSLFTFYQHLHCVKFDYLSVLHEKDTFTAKFYDTTFFRFQTVEYRIYLSKFCLAIRMWVLGYNIEKHDWYVTIFLLIIIFLVNYGIIKLKDNKINKDSQLKKIPNEANQWIKYHGL